MSKQPRKSDSASVSSTPPIARRDDILFEKLSESTFGDDLAAVLKSINAFQGSAGDRILENQMRSNVSGKVLTLDNMNNSSFYQRKRVSQVNPTARELVSMNRAKAEKVYEYSTPITFSELDDLCSMWSLYAKSFLDLVHTLTASECPAGVPLVERKQTLVCRKLELLGAYLKVSESSNKQLLGLGGRVTQEGENVFHLIDEKNRIRMIPKEVSVFTLVISDTQSITLRGKDLIGKRLGHSF
jgi:RNase P/RNase MRP subunit p29